jgi:hypothetical protein
VTRAQLAAIYVRLARKEIGVREVGNNGGKRVLEYQASDTLKGGYYPWCASFTAFEKRETTRETGIAIPWSYSASCDVIWADAKARGLIVPRPTPGCDFLVRAKLKNGNYSNSDAIHTGIVATVSGNSFTTIEGNSNSDGSREGNAVVSNSRPLSSRYVFIDWTLGVNLSEEEAPLPWKVLVAGKTLDAVNVANTNFVSVREFGDALNKQVIWDSEDLVAILNGIEVPSQARFIDGRAYYPVRVLADVVNLAITVNQEKRMIRVD